MYVCCIFVLMYVCAVVVCECCCMSMCDGASIFAVVCVNCSCMLFSFFELMSENVDIKHRTDFLCSELVITCNMFAQLLCLHCTVILVK